MIITVYTFQGDYFKDRVKQAVCLYVHIYINHLCEVYHQRASAVVCFNLILFIIMLIQECNLLLFLMLSFCFVLIINLIKAYVQ